MDNELEKRWLKLPEVRVEHDESILKVNDRFLSLPDITPAVLSDYLEIGQKTIHTHLLEIRKRYQYWGDSKSRPLILIGRLALTGRQEEALSEVGLKCNHETDIAIDGLYPEYRGYWTAIEDTHYKPEVRLNMMLNNEALDGTWLDLRRP